MKHTPGPWKFHEQGEANEYAVLTNEKRWVISFRQNGELLTEEQKANARLIAVAPKMLEALQATLDALYNETHGKEDTVWIKQVKKSAAAAIQEATHAS